MHCNSRGLSNDSCTPNTPDKDKILETGHTKRYLILFSLSLSSRISPIADGFSPAETSTTQILLLSDSVSQPSNSASNSDTDISTDNSLAATPLESGTPTGTVVIPSRYRSGTIIARQVWDPPTQATTGNVGSIAPAHFPINPSHLSCRARHRELPPDSHSTSTDVSRPETETEDDGDGDVDMDRMQDNGRIDSDVASVEIVAPAMNTTPTNTFGGGEQRALLHITITGILILDHIEMRMFF